MVFYDKRIECIYQTIETRNSQFVIYKFITLKTETFERKFKHNRWMHVYTHTLPLVFQFEITVLSKNKSCDKKEDHRGKMSLN